MSTDATMAASTDPGDRALHRAGGIAGIGIAVCYLVIIGLYAVVGALPSGGGEAVLSDLEGKLAPWWGIVGLSVLTDLLYVPLAVALWVALKGANRNAMLLGAGLLLLFVVLDLAVTQTTFAALLALGAEHAVATDDALRAADIAAATYAASVLESDLFPVYVILVPGLGLLAIGIAMLSASFDRVTAWLGILTGVSAVAAVAGPYVSSALEPLYIVTSVLTTLWVAMAGYRLIRLAARDASAVGAGSG